MKTKMTKKPIKVQCPYCGELAVPVQKSRARWIGGIAGAGVGWKIGGGLGIAGSLVGGAIVGTWLAVPVGVGFGYLLAEKAFTKNRCPKCNEKLN